jgi:hypothetical protein
LNREIFFALTEAEALIEPSRSHYNTIRPDGVLRYRPPARQTVGPICPQTLTPATKNFDSVWLKVCDGQSFAGWNSRIRNRFGRKNCGKERKKCRAANDP